MANYEWMTQAEINKTPIKHDGSSIGAIYLSIEALGHEVLKCQCNGVMGSLMDMVAHYRRKYPNHIVRVWPEYIGDRVTLDGNIYKD